MKSQNSSRITFGTWERDKCGPGCRAIYYDRDIGLLALQRLFVKPAMWTIWEWKRLFPTDWPFRASEISKFFSNTVPKGAGLSEHQLNKILLLLLFLSCCCCCCCCFCFCFCFCLVGDSAATCLHCLLIHGMTLFIAQFSRHQMLTKMVVIKIFLNIRHTSSFIIGPR